MVWRVGVKVCSSRVQWWLHREVRSDYLRLASLAEVLASSLRSPMGRLPSRDTGCTGLALKLPSGCQAPTAGNASPPTSCPVPATHVPLALWNPALQSPVLCCHKCSPSRIPTLAPYTTGRSVGWCGSWPDRRVMWSYRKRSLGSSEISASYL